jgi:hypothetical protein
MTVFERIDRRERNINSVLGTIILLAEGVKSFSECAAIAQPAIEPEEQAQLTEMLSIITAETDKGARGFQYIKMYSMMNLYEQKKLSVRDFENVFGLTPCDYESPYVPNNSVGI